MNYTSKYSGQINCRRRNYLLRKSIDQISQKPIKVSGWCFSPLGRCCSLIVAIILLLALLPILLVIAIAIKLDSRGPVLFSQYRTGYKGRRIVLYKFRTMVEDAEPLKFKLADKNKHGPNSIDFKVEKDPRITFVGQFLRKTSLDEMPNLLSVICSDLRLIGPRPTSFCASTYEPNQLVRLLCHPGITGIWQTSGRSNIDFPGRVNMDREYIENASIWLDMKLLLKTFTSVFRRDGAA